MLHNLIHRNGYLDDPLYPTKTENLMKPAFQIHNGDSREELKILADCSIDSIVTDPPAGISFMGKDWDHNKGGRDQWIKWMTEIASECLRALKPGGHALVWAIPRTSHWTATAWENAGFEVRDRVSHLFGSGFPKSLDISKALDAAAGAEREVIGRAAGASSSLTNSLGVFAPEYNRTAHATDAAKQWNGWGTALKPACEDWWLLRKPLIGTVAQNILEHGTGGLNVDGCRIETNWLNERGETWLRSGNQATEDSQWQGPLLKREGSSVADRVSRLGRWPANVITSYPEDEYLLRSDVTPDQRKELLKWIYENA